MLSGDNDAVVRTVARQVGITGKALTGRELEELEGEELIARCICHECDHLDGHLYTEIAYRKVSDEELESMHTIGEGPEK